jgi:hypothetical protein
MEPADGIRKFGFRRWYERQLVESHCYLVTCFLCFVVVLACIEGFSFRAEGWEPFMRLAVMIAGSALGAWALGRYKVMLDLAEYTAEQSTCTGCGTYGALEVSGVRVLAQERAKGGRREEGEGKLIGVRCRRCGHEWTIQ